MSAQDLRVQLFMLVQGVGRVFNLLKIVYIIHYWGHSVDCVIVYIPAKLCFRVHQGVSSLSGIAVQRCCSSNAMFRASRKTGRALVMVRLCDTQSAWERLGLAKHALRG